MSRRSRRERALVDPASADARSAARWHRGVSAMLYLPEGIPEPEPGLEDAPFWEGCRAHRLLIQRCTECGRFRHPPAPFCPACRSSAREWREISGDGEVFSYTVAHHAAHAALRGAIPYNIAVVMLDGTGDVRLLSNVVDAAPEELHVGMRVRIQWEALPGGAVLPRFRKAQA